MKKSILIVGTHRSGTTNLTNALSRILNLKMLQEPWNYYLFNTDENKYPEVLKEYGVIKSLVQQLPVGWKPKDRVKFYVELVNRYSNVILLGRKDRNALAESYFRQMQFGDSNWHKTYSLEHPSMLKLDMEFINSNCDTLVEISKETNIPITWYEDLYSGNVEQVTEVLKNWNFKINIKTLMENTNPLNRYRKFNLI